MGHIQNSVKFVVSVNLQSLSNSEAENTLRVTLSDARVPFKGVTVTKRGLYAERRVGGAIT